MIEITKEHVDRINDYLDAGLPVGLGSRERGRMCVEAVVSVVTQNKLTDRPVCVASSIRDLAVTLNDSKWSSNQARAEGLRRFAIAQLGTYGKIDENEFSRRVAKFATQTCVATALRAAASVCSEPHKSKLLGCALECEREGTVKTANAEAYAAKSTAHVANAANAVAYAVYVAKVAKVANAVYVAKVANAAARDRILTDFANGVADILVEMGTEGSKWLDFAEAKGQSVEKVEIPSVLFERLAVKPIVPIESASPTKQKI